jgi:hypothetical protein
VAFGINERLPCLVYQVNLKTYCWTPESRQAHGWLLEAS